MTYSAAITVLPVLSIKPQSFFSFTGAKPLSENVSASKSRIVDTDFAAESAQLAQTQVQQQAASSMLSQANQSSQVALSLL